MPSKKRKSKSKSKSKGKAKPKQKIAKGLYVEDPLLKRKIIDSATVGGGVLGASIAGLIGAYFGITEKEQDIQVYSTERGSPLHQVEAPPKTKTKSEKAKAALKKGAIGALAGGLGGLAVGNWSGTAGEAIMRKHFREKSKNLEK